MKKYCLLNFILAIAMISSAQQTWLAKDSFPGMGRVYAATFSINGTGYAVGGFTQYTGTWVNEVWAYNASTDTWIQKNNFPVTTADGAYFVINNNAYVVGGYRGGGQHTNTNCVYNPGSDSWSAKASFPESGVGAAFQFVINGLGYVGSGLRNGANNSTSVYAYNPESDSWSSVASYPESMANTVGFAIDSLGYSGLGSDGSDNLSTGFYSYSPGSNTWTPIAAFPGEPRNGGVSFVLDGKGYVGGGWTNVPGNPAIHYNLGDFYCYDPSSNSWSVVPGLTGRGRNNPSPFIINDNAYIFGGYDFYTANVVGTVSEFATCSSVAAIAPVTGGNARTGITIYPNPSSSDLTVKIGAQVTNEVKYQVVSVDGKLVKKGTTMQNTFSLSDNGFSDGIYILTITDNQEIQGEQRFEVIH